MKYRKSDGGWSLRTGMTVMNGLSRYAHLAKTAVSHFAPSYTNCSQYACTPLTAKLPTTVDGRDRTLRWRL